MRKRFGVGLGEWLEEVLLFWERTGEEVESTTKMLEMYGARRKKIEEQVDRSAQQ